MTRLPLVRPIFGLCASRMWHGCTHLLLIQALITLFSGCTLEATRNRAKTKYESGNLIKEQCALKHERSERCTAGSEWLPEQRAKCRMGSGCSSA